MVNFDPLTPEIKWLMFTHFKSTVRFLLMLIHLSLGHVTLLSGEFQLSNFFPNWTSGFGWIHVGLCPKFLVERCNFVVINDNTS